MPCPLDDDQFGDDSTDVPSPHSLYVVTSCHLALDAFMTAMSQANRARSRDSRSAWPNLWKPGEIVTEYGRCRSIAWVGAY